MPGGIVPVGGGWLQPWHQQLIPLLAIGTAPRAIALQLNMPINRVMYAKKLPIVIAAVGEIQRQALGKVADEIADAMARDTLPNIEWLKSVRDGTCEPDAHGDMPSWRERLGAAVRLADSQIPKRIVRHDESGNDPARPPLPPGVPERLAAAAMEGGFTLTVHGASERARDVTPAPP